jgi:hypothetical protein
VKGARRHPEGPRPKFGEQSGFVVDPLELRAHEKAGRGAVDEFLVASDIGAVPEEDTGDAMDEAWSVLAFDQEDA